MEMQAKCDVYQISMRCDKCNKGEMRPTGRLIQLTSYPPINKFEHKCTSCGNIELYKQSYPHMALKPIETSVERPNPVNVDIEDESSGSNTKTTIV